MKKTQELVSFGPHSRQCAGQTQIVMKRLCQGRALRLPTATYVATKNHINRFGIGTITGTRIGVETGIGAGGRTGGGGVGVGLRAGAVYNTITHKRSLRIFSLPPIVSKLPPQVRKSHLPAALTTSSTTPGPDTTIHTSGTSPSPSPQDAYRTPSTGILSSIPATWVPYGELIRLDKPAGTIYLFLPCLWSTLLASTLTPATPEIPMMLTNTALFMVGSIIMRGAGCTINDFWDRKLDPLVTRTKFRPIARGAVTSRQTLGFLTSQLLAGACVLFSLPVECIYLGIPSLILISTYPLAKRVTHYPQIMLGLSFSWGALLGFPAMGLSLIDPTILAPAACLYASNVAWTILYDTIYAHQDRSDDVKAGIKSIAVRHEHNSKKIMLGAGVIQLCFLSAAGILAGCGPIYFIGSCGGASVGLGWMIYRARLKVPSECWYWFNWCAIVVGGAAIGGGLMGEYLAQRLGLYENKRRKVLYDSHLLAP